MRKKGMSRELFTITMILIVLLAVTLFVLISNIEIEQLFLGGLR